MSTWKHIERKLAEMLGGKRVPVSGRTGREGMDSPDIEHPLYSIEVKHRELVPKWLAHAWDQAEASRQPHHLAAITLIHIKGQRMDRTMVQLPLADFIRLQSGYGDADDTVERRLDAAAS